MMKVALLLCVALKGVFGELVEIVSPVPGEVFERSVRLEVVASEVDEICWEVFGKVVKQTIGACYGRGQWNQTVNLPSRGMFTASAVGRKDGKAVATATREFALAVDPACQEALRKRKSKALSVSRGDLRRLGGRRLRGL